MSMTLPADLARRLQALRPRRVATGGGLVETLEAGRENAPAVLLLHGIGSTASSWLYQLEELADTYRVLAWNAPGYGASTPLAATRPAAADYAAALQTFCDAANLTRLHLVGQSLGALIATAFARRCAERVIDLTLLNPARGYGRAAPEERDRRLRQRLDDMARLGPEGNAERRAPAQLSTEPSATALALVRWNLARLNPGGYTQAAHMLAGAHLADDADFTGPVQVLSGDADRLVSGAAAREVAGYFVDSRFYSLPGLGHAAYAEGPGPVNDRLRGFFAGATKKR